MTTVYQRAILSASTKGEPIAVAATAIGSGTVIHTAFNGSASQFDEVYLWASNIDTVEHALTLAVGGTGTPNLIVQKLVIPPNSPPMPVLCGLTFQQGIVLYAAADVTNIINITGHANQAQ